MILKETCFVIIIILCVSFGVELRGPFRAREEVAVHHTERRGETGIRKVSAKFEYRIDLEFLC